NCQRLLKPQRKPSSSYRIVAIPARIAVLKTLLISPEYNDRSAANPARHWTIPPLLHCADDGLDHAAFPLSGPHPQPPRPALYGNGHDGGTDSWRYRAFFAPRSVGIPSGTAIGRQRHQRTGALRKAGTAVRL